MTQPATISADYTLRPSELASVLALLVEARQPTIVWGPPGAAKSMIAQQVAAAANRQYVDIRALLLDPVDLRGIPWRDGADRTRWAPPAFLPPSDDTGRWLINLEELPSAVPMVQAALYQLVLDRKVGEYELPDPRAKTTCLYVTCVVITRRREFRDSSLMRTPARSCAEPESPRARAPYTAGCELPPGTRVLTGAHVKYWNRSPSAYGHRRSSAGTPFTYVGDEVQCAMHGPITRPQIPARGGLRVPAE